MNVQPNPWEDNIPGSYPDMDYLLSEAARSRYVIAAHHVRDCPVVVEIGGFKTPITGYLTHTPERVLMVDPLVQEYHSNELRGARCRVDHVRGRFQDHDFELPIGDYGFVCLGVSLKHFGDEPAQRAKGWSKWLRLVDQSRVAVLEYALDWALGSELAQRTVAESKTRLVVQMDLDLSKSPGMDTVHFRRRLVVLRPEHA